MYAIIRTGGKQAKVRPGDVLDVERLKGAGDEVTFTPILVVDESGRAISDRSALSEAKVVAKVLGETKGPKIDIFKYKPKTGYRRRMGHRQTYTQVEVVSIDLAKKRSRKQPAKPKAQEPKASTEEPKAPQAKASTEEE